MTGYIVDEVMVIDPKLEIEITADDDDEISISHELDDSGSILKIDVLCSSFTPGKLNLSGQSVISDWLFKFVIEVFSHMLRPKDTQKTLDSMIGEDRAIERSVSFGSSFIGQKNIMGDDYLNEVKTFLADEQYRVYELLRSEPWDKDFPKEDKDLPVLGDYKPGAGETPERLLNEESRSHRDMKVQNLIKPRLWGRTVWSGTGYAIHPDGTPEITLAFEDEHAAKAIFSDLKNELGSEDKRNRLRVSMIRNIKKEFPAHYRVVIGENVDLEANQVTQMISRLNTMEPNNKQSVEIFLEAFERMGRYEISFGYIQDGQMMAPTGDRVSIRKHQINVMDEWEIGPNHPEISAVRKTDDPIIPEGVQDPPVYKVFNLKFDQ